jgi:cephalosporin-C deacetylase-like acetyl esterase
MRLNLSKLNTSLQLPKQPFHIITTMPQRNITFQTSDNVTLRGWLFTPPESASTRLPCLVMSHGWSALKEMDLDAFANYFISKLPLACLVYDHRGFGDSDHAKGQPRQEIVPSLQRSDISDAITYAQSLPEVDGSRIGIWGSSYSGGHVLEVAAVDRRVKAVVSQAWVLPTPTYLSRWAGCWDLRFADFDF